VRERSLATAVCLALVCLALVIARPLPAGAQAIGVYVDGDAVTFDQPPLVVGGRVLVPLRGVFERLGARVDWQPQRRVVVATLGSTVVVLQPDRVDAEVSGQPVRLDVPATIVGGRVLVPLRFVSEALGAGVDWNPNARVIYVTSAGAAVPAPVRPAPIRPIFPPPAPPAPVITPPPAPAQPAPTTIEGTVLRVEAYAAPPRLHVRADSGILSIIVRPDTAVFVSEVTTGRGGAASLDAIQRGDLARVTFDPSGRAVTVRVLYRELSGRLDRVGARAVFLTDGQAFRVVDEVLVLLDGREATRDLLRQGMDVTLRLHPQTAEVWVVRAISPVPPSPVPPFPVPPPRLPRIVPAPPVIDWVSVNAPRMLGIGDTLVVSVRGTPGSEAWFDIARVERGVRMVEGPPGRYTGRYTIRSGEVVASGAVTVRLRLGGLDTERVADTVTVDGVPPEFVRRVPEPDSIARSSQPTIAVWFSDRGPSGVNPVTARLWVNGIEARRTGVSEASAVFAVAEPLASGRARVQARIVDHAGNEATTSWIFTVDLPAPSPPPVVLPTPTVSPSRPPLVVTPSPTPAQATPAPTPTSVGRTPAPTPAQPVAPPVITSPKTGEAIRPEIIVRGTVTPGHRVLLTLEVQAPGAATPRVVGPISVTPSSTGAWEARIEVPGAQSAVGMTLTAVAVSQSGARSEPAKVTLVPPIQRDPERP